MPTRIARLQLRSEAIKVLLVCWLYDVPNFFGKICVAENLLPSDQSAFTLSF